MHESIDRSAGHRKQMSVEPMRMPNRSIDCPLGGGSNAAAAPTGRAASSAPPSQQREEKKTTGALRWVSPCLAKAFFSLRAQSAGRALLLCVLVAGCWLCRWVVCGVEEPPPSSIHPSIQASGFYRDACLPVCSLFASPAKCACSMR